MSEIELTKEQTSISESIADWFQYSPYSPTYQAICGYAGTGKTVLLSKLPEVLRYKKNLRFAFCAYTGKASSVLNSKLDKRTFIPNVDFCGTIHQLMYRPTIEFCPTTNSKKIVGWKKNTEIPYDLILVDEASMINHEIWKDLLSYKVPIIIVGDHGQLPPIKDSFNILTSRDTTPFILKTIHRQALNNPIIQLSINIRRTGIIKHGIYSPHVFKSDWNIHNTQKMFNNITFDKDTMLLCGFNSTRVNLNQIIRDKNNLKKPYPYPSERVICLKNNRQTKVMNGQLGTVRWIHPKGPDLYDMTIEMDDLDEFYCNLVHKYCFGRKDYTDSHDKVTGKDIKVKYGRIMRESKTSTIDLFDFGYAISVHKSQGSEWDRIVLFEQRSNHWDDKYFSRWLYTAVTRARQKLFIISNYW